MVNENNIKMQNLYKLRKRYRLSSEKVKKGEYKKVIKETIRQQKNETISSNDSTRKPFFLEKITNYTGTSIYATQIIKPIC